MAEARLAVAFQFAVTDEGVVVNVDKEVVKLMARSAYKSVKRRCKYARNTILKGVYPASPATWMFVLAAVLAARHHQHEVTMDMLGRMERGFPGWVLVSAHLWSPPLSSFKGSFSHPNRPLFFAFAIFTRRRPMSRRASHLLVRPFNRSICIAALKSHAVSC